MDLFAHINYLELKAAFLGLCSLCKNEQDTYILLQMDNTTAVAYIQNMGGNNSLFISKLARYIWFWCKSKNIWLTATHIPGSENRETDQTSRKFDGRHEWKLDSLNHTSTQETEGRPGQSHPDRSSLAHSAMVAKNPSAPTSGAPTQTVTTRPPIQPGPDSPTMAQVTDDGLSLVKKHR
ncbi:uncharacterized protein LOC106151203 [Lingula anatina]|uniref:Uncharacterized protein LOC106151203 n=1 Tax=Lingula anatina TaxID=7574 RepID=A0A1S3H2R8_LINAN|nr:uncharacterized protein LOC106151203 [Lingula anatina]|eukprot:XP_013379776.1 uncharacterized protein LOC106151203 [Lingula anatina]